MNAIAPRLATAAAALLLTAGLGMTDATASAATAGDRRPCVTGGEFGQVHKGMRMRRVAAIFDTNGERVSAHTRNGHHWVKRTYPPCADFGYFTITYRDGRYRSAVANY